MAGVTATLFLILFLIYVEETGPALSALASMSSMLLTGATGFRSIGGGFSANVLVSLVAMAISLVAGTILGAGLIAKSRIVRLAFSFVMNFLRNSPWLVILYAMLYLIPYEVSLFGRLFTLSPMVKAIIGLSLPITANVAEVFRGGVESIPEGQWEASRSLGYSRSQILREVILPQALPLMIPSIMTVYAALFIGTSLIVVTGTDDIISIARVLIASGADRYATAIYLFILFVFFAFAFPIAMATRWFERRLRSVSA
ncbi:MAG: ABC transporter permease subunit [Aquamicrobium sp.]|uniref:amino acid ABC transporter permease n=1 Tax=Aquamicrobium sp. TaxID=1872579 RepID=UPI00349E8843|nr:ABC transporter permease subunit [Aquamicrobium sp.]